MKKAKTLVLFIVISVFFYGCTKEKENSVEPASIMPVAFKVDLNDAISSSDGVSKKTDSGDTISGNDIYKSIRFFIRVGESSAETVESLMFAVAKHKINKPMDIMFLGDDGRQKHLVVTENVIYENVTYQYKLNIEDSNTTALQLFWNTKPVKGVAIMSIYNINRKEDITLKNAFYKVEYSEAEANYDARMIVSISNLPLNPLDNGSINNLKLFVGKKGDIIDIYGNSNHPNIKLVDENFTGGRNYAFVAHGNKKLNIGVAMVALPPSSIASTSDMFTKYSVDSVFRAEVKIKFPSATDEIIDPYLKNTKPPGYFTSAGFVSSGTNIPSSDGFTSDFIDLSGLTPFIPNEIKNLSIKFQ